MEACTVATILPMLWFYLKIFLWNWWIDYTILLILPIYHEIFMEEMYQLHDSKILP